MSEETPNLIPVVRNGVTELVSEDTSKYDQLENEIEEVKTNLQAIAEIGENAIKDLAELAKASQNAKVYEALAAAIKAVNETNKELNMTLKSKKDLIESRSSENDSPAGPQTVNNNLIMTTTEMIRMLKAADESEQ